MLFRSEEEVASRMRTSWAGKKVIFLEHVDSTNTYAKKISEEGAMSGTLVVTEDHDWQSSADLYFVLKKYLRVRNRITWQREKGRGAKNNWKNSCEDIFFATMGDEYFFDVDAVKLKRAVRAPYKENGKPKDWSEIDGKKFRMTHPGNFWDDISIPFWSMAENKIGRAHV